VAKIGALGLHGITVEEEYAVRGSAISSTASRSRRFRAVGVGWPVYGAHSNLCVNQIRRNGNEAQKRKYLPKLISGEHVGSLAMSEPNAGSDVVSMATRAEKKGDRFVINGSKMWITNGTVADTLVVYAKTMPPLARAHHRFIIEKGMKDFHRAKARQAGHARSDTCELLFDNCEVPEESVLSEVGRGVNVLMSGSITSARCCRGPLGIMQACMDVVMPMCTSASSSASRSAPFNWCKARSPTCTLR